jgi:hypothetical protein
MGMRHKWDGKLKRGVHFVTCVKCRTSKQRYYGVMLYFTDLHKDPFEKAPNCEIVEHYNKCPNAELKYDDYKKVLF